MNVLIIIRVALRSLRRTALRSSLTALGVIIGVAAVVALLSIGNGARARIEKALGQVDTNQIRLDAMMPAPPSQPWGRQPPPPGKGLNFEDYRALRQAFSGHAAVNIVVWASNDRSVPAVKANGRSSPAHLLYGIDTGDAGLEISNLARGAAISASDVSDAASVCLITQTVAKNLFSSEDALGRAVLISNIPFRVIGIMKDNDASPGLAAQDFQDTRVVVPYTSVLRRLNRNAADSMQIIVKPDNPSQLAETQQRLSDLMEHRRGNRKVDFLTGNISQFLKTERQNSQTLGLLLASIAGISLVVGGIGIMNIMLVSVTERTREIGIRLAIGTRDRDVLRQFLIEAVILSVLGGAIGIALGIAAAKVIGKFGELQTVITPGSILGAFLCSAAIGIFFGWYPARQAARLDPIEALRAE